MLGSEAGPETCPFGRAGGSRHSGQHRELEGLVVRRRSGLTWDWMMLVAPEDAGAEDGEEESERRVGELCCGAGGQGDKDWKGRSVGRSWGLIDWDVCITYVLGERREKSSGVTSNSAEGLMLGGHSGGNVCEYRYVGMVWETSL